jgi:hypothetical protein
MYPSQPEPGALPGAAFCSTLVEMIQKIAASTAKNGVAHESAKARAFRTFSPTDTVAERIKEQIVQDGVFELEVLALSLASDLFSLAKVEARS